MNKNKFLDIIGMVGSFASIIGCIFIKGEWNVIKIVVISVLVVLFFVAVYSVFFMKDKNIVTCTSEDKIKEFMKDWIETNGVVKVLSRDLSWVDANTIDLLANKGNDLNLFVEKETEKTKKIKELNLECNIFYYGELGIQPKSRFTIIHANKQEKQMAIAIKQEKNYKKIIHNIYITNGGDIDKKLLCIADDLIEYLMKNGRRA